MKLRGLLLVVGAGVACEPAPEPPRPAPSATGARSATPAPVAAPPSASAAAPAPSACPPDMVLAEGAFCPRVEQRCRRHTKAYERERRARRRARREGTERSPRPVPEICLEYEEPSRCLSDARTPMRFCVDRLEWPGREGELPLLLVTWGEARSHCESRGKRLCTADELTFACEGEAMLPYSYGYVRDPERCNQDKPYVTPQRNLMPYAACVDSPGCKAELERLDQREPVGSRPRCTSPFGALDLNGNVNEWVERPGREEPWRSGLKGGWWGPARSRCRPMVTAHDENYAGYEVGFRCCRDAK